MNETTTAISKAAALVKAKDYEQALQVLKILTESEPKNEIGLGMLASVYAEINMGTKASKTYDQILNINPKNSLARFQLGLLHYNNSDYSTALKTWQPALDDDNDYMTKYFTGLSLIKTDELSSGMEYLKQAEKIMPKDHTLYAQLHQHISDIN